MYTLTHQKKETFLVPSGLSSNMLPLNLGGYFDQKIVGGFWHTSDFVFINTYVFTVFLMTRKVHLGAPKRETPLSSLRLNDRHFPLIISLFYLSEVLKHPSCNQALEVVL